MKKGASNIYKFIEIDYEIDHIKYTASFPVNKGSIYQHEMKGATLPARITAIGWQNVVPELHRLVFKTVDLHELNYLAKRLQSMTEAELESFNAQIYIEHLDTPRDMINAAYDLGKYYVINDFALYADKERLGKELFKAKNMAWSENEINAIDFTAYAEEIKKACPMIETPYGIAVRFREDSINLYTETAFLPFADKPCVLSVQVTKEAPVSDLSSEMLLYLPESTDYITAMLRRIGVEDDARYTLDIECLSLNRSTQKLLESLEIDDVYELNEMAKAIERIQQADQENLFTSALEVIPVQSLQDVMDVIESLDSFEFSDGPTPADYARIYVERELRKDSQDIFHTIDSFIDYEGLGIALCEEYPIKEVTMGYLVYPQELADEIQQRHADNDMKIV